MGKTPKEKVNERRRPYNYLRNTQAQGQFSGNETRNHYYSSAASVPRPVPYHRLRAAAPNQFYRGPFRGELYRDRATNIPKLGRPPHLKRQFPNRKVVSPLRRPPRRTMQSDLEEQNSQTKESAGEVLQQEEHNLKNGPAPESSNTNEEKEKMENGLAADTDGSEKAQEQDSTHLDDVNPGAKAKSAPKEKKAKKSESVSKPKGRHSPKSTKEKKLESTEAQKSEKNDTEATESEAETKDKKATKKVKKETESHHVTSEHTQPSVKVLRLNTEMLTASPEMNDSSVVEIPVGDAEEKQDVVPSTSSDWPAPSRRSTRLQEQKNTQDDSIIIVQKSDQDESILVLDNEAEFNRSSKNLSFGEALISMRGRRSLRPLPPLNLPSRLHTFSSRAPDPLVRSFSSVFHKSSKSVTTSDLAADNDVDANSTSTEESGAEISEPSSTAAEDVNMSGKRKISSDEMQNEHKRFRSIDEEQINSSGFLSMISSPMNAFASRIKSGQSSTPVNLVKVSPLANEDVSEIAKEETEENVDVFMEKSDKESVQVVVESGQAGAPQKKWCSVM